MEWSHRPRLISRTRTRTGGSRSAAQGPLGTFFGSFLPDLAWLTIGREVTAVQVRSGRGRDRPLPCAALQRTAGGQGPVSLRFCPWRHAKAMAARAVLPLHRGIEVHLVVRQKSSKRRGRSPTPPPMPSQSRLGLARPAAAGQTSALCLLPAVENTDQCNAAARPDAAACYNTCPRGAWSVGGRSLSHLSPAPLDSGLLIYFGRERAFLRLSLTPRGTKKDQGGA